MSLSYFAGDERPAWIATVTVNGTADDMSSGYTFEVKVVAADGTVALTKTTNITGGTGGSVTVAWVPNELGLAAGAYTAQLKAIHTADSAEWTIVEPVQILTRS